MSISNLSRNKNGNAFVAIIIILFLLTLIGLAGVLYWEKEQITQKYLVVIEKAEQERNKLKDEIYVERSEKEKNALALLALEDKMGNLQTRYAKLEQEYEHVVNLKEFMENKFNEFSSATIDGWKRLEMLSERLDQQLVALSDTSGQLSKKKGLISSKTFSYDKRSVEIPPVIVKEKEAQRRESAPAKKVRRKVKRTPFAQIMSVNVEHNFVVINKGLIDGIRVGDVFQALRRDKSFATVQISEVRDFVSLGMVKDIKANMRIIEGDTLSKMYSEQ